MYCNENICNYLLPNSGWLFLIMKNNIHEYGCIGSVGLMKMAKQTRSQLHFFRQKQPQRKCDLVLHRGSTGERERERKERKKEKICYMVLGFFRMHISDIDPSLLKGNCDFVLCYIYIYIYILGLSLIID